MLLCSFSKEKSIYYWLEYHKKSKRSLKRGTWKSKSKGTPIPWCRREGRMKLGKPQREIPNQTHSEGQAQHPNNVINHRTHWIALWGLLTHPRHPGVLWVSKLRENLLPKYLINTQRAFARGWGCFLGEYKAHQESEGEPNSLSAVTWQSSWKTPVEQGNKCCDTRT